MIVYVVWKLCIVLGINGNLIIKLTKKFNLYQKKCNYIFEFFKKQICIIFEFLNSNIFGYVWKMRKVSTISV